MMNDDRPININKYHYFNLNAYELVNFIIFEI